VIFFSNIIKAPRVLKGGAYIKKRKEKRKAPMVSSNKRGSQYFERRKRFKFKNPF
jgi:hypothetical protein